MSGATATHRGLSRIATSRIRDLCKAVANSVLTLPLDSFALKAAGFAEFAHVAAQLAAVGDGALVFLESILADREYRRGPSIDLVWSGPSPVKNDALDTHAVVQRLFANAEEHVMICGFAFYQADAIFSALYQRAKERRLNVEFFIHVDAQGAKSAQAFYKYSWPWRDVPIEVYYDPQTLAGGVSMHAKSIVVDKQTAFVTSANFTTAAHSTNVEIGALIGDSTFAAGLVAHWHRLKAEGIFVELKST